LDSRFASAELQLHTEAASMAFCTRALAAGSAMRGTNGAISGLA